MRISYPCGICSKPVAKTHHAITCDICNKWIHKKCNFIDTKTYKKLKASNDTWYCLVCTKKLYHFPV